MSGFPVGLRVGHIVGFVGDSVGDPVGRVGDSVGLFVGRAVVGQQGRRTPGVFPQPSVGQHFAPGGKP